jgi:hypothetical protein
MSLTMAIRKYKTEAEDTGSSHPSTNMSFIPISYERTVPYSYCNHHQYVEKSDYGSPRSTVPIAHGQGMEKASQGNARRRIQVAVSY